MLASTSAAAAMWDALAWAEERSCRSSTGCFFLEGGGGAEGVVDGLGFRVGGGAGGVFLLLLPPNVLISSTAASSLAPFCAPPSSSSSSSSKIGRLFGAGAAFFTFSPYLSDILCESSVAGQSEVLPLQCRSWRSELRELHDSNRHRREGQRLDM